MTMHRFDPANDRGQPMDHSVSFHDVPMPRMVAYVLRDCELHGAKVSIASCIRVDAIVEEHNRTFGTNLHGQQACIDAHARDPAHNAAANPVDQTSHCWRSDGRPAYRDQHGHHIPARGELPKYMIGVDVDDVGKHEDNSHLMQVSHNRGWHFVAPYQVGSELHHLVLVMDPIPLLEHFNIIHTERHP